MWPVWLIITVAVGSAVALTTVSVGVVLHVERKKRRNLMNQAGLDRNLSQYHRPHLSINDIDFANLPTPTRALRQSVQTSRRDSRFYSTMPSEDEIRTFPDGTADSLAEANYVHTNTDRSNQWLNPSKAKKLEKRYKKSLQLSMKAPMAKSPGPSELDQPEVQRKGSPEPVELPAHVTPTVTPEKIVIPKETMPQQSQVAHHIFEDNCLAPVEKRINRVSTRIDNGNPIKSRSISMGSIAPPDCPLPPVPERSSEHDSSRSRRSRSISELSGNHRDISLLNSPLLMHTEPSKQPVTAAVITVEPASNFHDFKFGLSKEDVQVITVDNHVTWNHSQQQLSRSGPLSMYLASRQQSPTRIEGMGTNAETGPAWVTPSYKKQQYQYAPYVGDKVGMKDQRPISSISMASSNGPLTSNRPESISPSFNVSSRPVSMSSVDIFRQSIVGANTQSESPNTSRSKGHRRQNCVRISGLTPIENSRKRLSTQLHRLAEAEETDYDQSPSKNSGTSLLSATSPREATQPSKISQDLNVSKIRQPQALSLRVRRPGLLGFNTKTSPISPTRPGADEGLLETVSPVVRPTNPLNKSRATDPDFIYAGSPLSDPTRPPPPRADFSPISPKHCVTVIQNTTPDKKTLRPEMSNSPEALISSPVTPILFSDMQSPDLRTIKTGDIISPKRHVTNNIHGPRIAPPPSLRTRNGNLVSPKSRQVSDRGSISPIRRTSQHKTSIQATTSGSRRNSASTQDELRRKTALLRSLTHAAAAGKAGGLPEVNMVKPSLIAPYMVSVMPAKSQLVAREESSLTERPKGPRQRSRTVAGHGLRPPMTRHEQASLTVDEPGTPFLPSSPSNISIWEDASVRDDSEHGSPIAPMRKSQNLEIAMHRRSKTITAAMNASTASTVAPQLEKQPLWKLQQNADVITSRALAFNNNQSRRPSYQKISSPSEKERKPSRLDGFWGDKLQKLQNSQDNDDVQSTDSYTLPKNSTTVIGSGMRKRSHTISTMPAKTSRNTIRPIETQQGVGLGVDFGRSGVGLKRAIVPGDRMNTFVSGGPVFLNEMERDGIGKLR